MAIVDEAGPAVAVDQHLGRHPPKLEQIDPLPIELEHRMLRIRKANERQSLFAPVLGEGLPPLWPYDNHLCPPFDELPVVLAQLRHMRPAEWSGESSVEDEQYVACAAIVREADDMTLEVF
jgi:hypothetical protein